MSSDDLDAFSGSRPYTCVSCGARMRTRGSDGRCYSCLEAPAVRCVVCARVRFEPGHPWEDHPGKLTREVPGTCRDCGDRAAKKQERAYRREFWAAQRRKAKGFGPWPEGHDAFEGMKEEG